jgi:putative effector of murein hydrolase
MITVSRIAVVVFGVALTVGAYSLSILARKRHHSPLTTPVLFSTAIIITVLLNAGTDFGSRQVDAAGTSNSTNVLLTRQKS